MRSTTTKIQLPISDLSYLATAYSHADPSVMEHRAKLACRVAARLQSVGIKLFAPIPHSHYIEKYGFGKRLVPSFWMQQDLAVLKHCGILYVLVTEGLDESAGVKEEIEFAIKHRINVIFITYNEETDELTF